MALVDTELLRKVFTTIPLNSRGEPCKYPFISFKTRKVVNCKYRWYPAWKHLSDDVCDAEARSIGEVHRPVLQNLQQEVL